MCTCKYACILGSDKINFKANLNATAFSLVTQLVPGSANT